jgi:hypothetical protein
MEKFCLYCGRSKPVEEFSDEHVLPDALGGNLHPNPLLLKNVCERCNNLCGFFVDGPFIKSWFTQNGTAQGELYAGRIKERVLPLNYAGEVTDLAEGGRICDFWLGPTGDAIYHFHQPYPAEEHIGFSVGPSASSHNVELDDGFVFIFLVSNNPDWHLPVFAAAYHQFRKRKGSQTVFYLGNGPKPRGTLFSVIPQERNALHSRLVSLNGKPRLAKVSIDIHQGERFLSKLALGFGALLLNSAFETSDAAALLRSYLKEKDWKKRASISLKQSGFTVPLPDRITGLPSDLEVFPDEVKKLPEWAGGHAFLLLPCDGELMLYARIFKMQSACIRITDNPSHWENLIDNEGLLLLITPGIQECFGPIKLSTFFKFKLNPSAPDVSSLAAFADRSRPIPLPPVYI